jgi:hypothetical protein
MVPGFGRILAVGASHKMKLCLQSHYLALRYFCLCCQPLLVVALQFKIKLLVCSIHCDLVYIGFLYCEFCY